MISIFNRLYFVEGKRGSDSAGPSEALCALLMGVLDGIGRHVLAGDGSGPLRQQFDEVKDCILRAESPEQLSQAEAAICRILASHRAETVRLATAQALEVQNIFAMLNQALIAMAEGRDRSVSRLSEIQNTLQRANMMRDILALKAALADTVRFVERENEEAKKSVNDELARLEVEVGKARESLQSRTQIAGRPEGVARIEESLRLLTTGQALYAVAYVCPRLTGIAQRYGPQVTDELIFRVIRERLQPLAPAGSVYRWTPGGLVVVVERPRNLTAVQSSVSALNRGPVVHKAALGNRTAVLTISPSVVVLEGTTGPPAQIVDQLDRFIGTHS
jgi:hypothetical protein